MPNWTQAELARIAATDDLHIAPLRDDGRTHGTLTWIWSVVVEGGLYARAYNGRKSSWHQAALRQKAGRITAAGMTRAVVFEAVDGPGQDRIQDRIDEAYRAKYRRSSYLAAMIGERARSATVRILPQNAETHNEKQRSEKRTE